MTWRRRWWMVRRVPNRRETIDAIQREWHWSRAAAEHAVDVWGFYPWTRIVS